MNSSIQIKMNDRYQTYSIEDLITDEQFIDWVLHPTSDKDQIWEKWMNQNPEYKSKALEAKSLIKNISFNEIETKGISAKLWQRIESDIEPEVNRSGTRIVRIISIATAAAAVIALLIYNLVADTEMTIQAKAGLATMHQLPDQSTIQINDGSSITYNKKTFDDARNVFLEGEAFFQVTKGNPFTVATTNGSVEVLGTSFNVFNHDGQFRVTCKTGSVKVTNGRNAVILTPGEEVELDDHKKLVKSKTDVVNISWLEGTFKYEEDPLKDVIAELERQFNITIHISESLKNTLYTGFFLDQNLEQALSSVFWPLKMQYSKRGNEVFISREN